MHVPIELSRFIFSSPFNMAVYSLGRWKKVVLLDHFLSREDVRYNAVL